MMEKQIPKTAEYINHMEEIFWKYGSDLDEYENASDEDRGILLNPMLHLAETIYLEAPEWAEDLAKYLCVICKIKRLDVEINVK